VKASTSRTSPLTVGASMPTEAEKHMDSEMQCFVYLCECEIWYLTIVDCFLRYALFDGVVDSREAMPPRGSSSSQSSGLTPRVSQIHLNYVVMENQIRTMQDVLAAEQEDHRETRESLAAYNAQMKAFMVVRNKNTFVAFITFSDIYVC
jgi:hypothetical protein